MVERFVHDYPCMRSLTKDRQQYSRDEYRRTRANTGWSGMSDLHGNLCWLIVFNPFRVDIDGSQTQGTRFARTLGYDM